MYVGAVFLKNVTHNDTMITIRGNIKLIYQRKFSIHIQFILSFQVNSYNRDAPFDKMKMRNPTCRKKGIYFLMMDDIT